MKCWKCMADIPDGGTFCPVCGADVNGVKETAGTLKTEENERAKGPEPGKGKGLFSSLIWCAVAVALTAGAAFYMKEEPVDAERDTLFYVKNGDFFGVDLSGKQNEPKKYSDLFSDNEYETDFYGGLITDIYGQEQYISKDGKFLYYPGDMDLYTSAYTLYCQEQGKDKVKIDRNVRYYRVTDDNKVIYQKKGNALYLFDGTDRKKLASNADSFSVDDNGKYVIWTSYNDADDYEDFSSKIFCQDLAMAEEKKELESAGELLLASKDFGRILIKKKNSLYLIENFGEPVKLVEDADEVKGVDLDQKSFYFVREPQETLTMMDYVEDDLKASDEAMTAPSRDDYLIEGEAGDTEDETDDDYENDWWNWDTDIVSDEYYEKQEAYEKKTSRDTIRYQLENETADFFKELYFYKDGTETLIDPHWQSFSYYITDENNNNVSYNRNADISVKKVKISEMTDTSDAIYKVQEANYTEPTEVIASGEKTVEIPKEYSGIGQRILSEDGQYLYFLCADGEISWDAENAYKLYCMKLDLENYGQITEIDSDVDVLECTDGPRIYYVKNARNYQGDLYVNGSLLVKNVNEYTTQIIPDSTKVACISDVDQEKNYGTLNVIQDGTATRIADRITYCDIIGENQIIMMQDYNEDKARGKLVYYDGEQTQDLDDDVFGIFPRGVGIECFSWSW